MAYNFFNDVLDWLNCTYFYQLFFVFEQLLNRWPHFHKGIIYPVKWFDLAFLAITPYLSFDLIFIGLKREDSVGLAKLAD